MVNCGVQIDCSCCGGKILIDGQYELSTWAPSIKAYWESVGYTVDYYSDVRASFSYDEYKLILLLLPDITVADGFLYDQWANIGDWTVAGRRLAIGADWRGQESYEYAVSDTVNALATGMTILSDEEYDALPVAGSTYTTEDEPLVNDGGGDPIVIKTGGSDEISGGTALCYGENADIPTTNIPFLAENTTLGVSYVLAGSPSVFNYVDSSDNNTFYQNLYTVV